LKKYFVKINKNLTDNSGLNEDLIESKNISKLKNQLFIRKITIAMLKGKRMITFKRLNSGKRSFIL